MSAPAVEVVIPSGTRLLKLADVKARTSLGHSTIYRWMGEGRFPRPVELSPGCVRWPESEIDAWINEKAAASAARWVA